MEMASLKPGSWECFQLFIGQDDRLRHDRSAESIAWSDHKMRRSLAHKYLG